MTEAPNPLLDAAGIALALTACGAAPNQWAIIAEGFTVMVDFLVLQLEEVSDMTQNLMHVAMAHGGVGIGAMLMKKLKALVCWWHECDHTGENLDTREFTQIVLQSLLESMSVEATKDKSPPELPIEFKAVK